jgi:hypothetical protein
MFDESISVVQWAIIYDIVASAVSAAAAVTAAMLLSKRLTPPLAEIERRAKKEIEKFVKTSSTLQTKTKSNEKGSSIQDSSELQHEMSDSQGPLMLLNTSGYLNREENLTQSFQILESFFSNATSNKNSLVVMTRRGSNLYYKTRNKEGAQVYVLSASAQSPLHTSEEGLLVISLNQTPILLEAVRRTLEENPSATIILDNATEIIHTLGFEKAFSLLRSIAEVASSYPKSHIVVLINVRAHERNQVESIANIANIFIEF